MANLDKYNKKRNFDKTTEPVGKIINKNSKKLKFVIQHHIARKDHYDLRLEYNGVYISFAVPKGLSFDPKDKRLAIKVEDHPLSYGNFEGVIPKGEYGAGTVMLFDKGYWYPDKEPDFLNGPIKFLLKGKRMVGRWSLIKFKDENWLIIKEKDEYVKNKDISSYKTSVKTGRTMNEIKNNKNKIDIILTNKEKLIFKNVTKEEIFKYYKKIFKRMYPFLSNRLISTVRSPHGMNGEKFFMKHLNNKNKGISKKNIKDKFNNKKDYYYIKNINGLLSEVQMNSYEFHIWNSQVDSIKKPDILVFDLDPDINVSLKKIRDCAKNLKNILDNLNLKSYVKTSGGKGYHIYVPINISNYKKCDEIASDIVDILINENPDKYTKNIRKDQRKNKIFIDYFRNKFGSTSVCPYSLRLKDNATISCPIYWREIDKIKPDEITIKNIDKRLKKRDPWANFFN